MLNPLLTFRCPDEPCSDSIVMGDESCFHPESKICGAVHTVGLSARYFKVQIEESEPYGQQNVPETSLGPAGSKCGLVRPAPDRGAPYLVDRISFLRRPNLKPNDQFGRPFNAPGMLIQQ